MSSHLRSVWDLETGELIKTLEGHADRVSPSAPNRHGVHRVIHRYNLICFFQVLSVAVAANGQILSGSDDKTIW